MRGPFKYRNTSPKVIRKVIPLAVMLGVRHPLSLRDVEVLLPERGIGRHETMRPCGRSIKRPDRSAPAGGTLQLV